MAWTQADIDALRTAIAKGIKRATVVGVTREFYSLEEMLQLIAAMERAVNGTPTYRLAQTKKGL
jgi:hypothetical protein